MTELLAANWPIVLVALVIGLGVAWFIFAANRRTGIDADTGDVLDDGTGPAMRNQALIDAAPGAPSAPPQPVLETDRPPLPASASGGDDLTRIKGVGPKLQELLNTLGVSRFEQIAEWADADIAAIDAKLGRFEGRIVRDSWVEQARLLAADDMQTFENRFGRL